MTDVKLWLLYSNTWNHLTVCKQMICCKEKYLEPFNFVDLC